MHHQAGATHGFSAPASGADLANVLNEAARPLTTRRGTPHVTMDLLDEAIDRAFLGITSLRHIMSEEERRVTYHEAGHALVALGVEGATPPHKVTILPRGGTAGQCTRRR